MDNLQKAKNLYKDKKVLILGLGINQGGVGAAKFFAQAEADVKITDLKDKETLKESLDQLKDFPNITYTLGEHKLEDIDWADIIVRNPALKPDNQYLKYAQEKGKQIEMDLGILIQFIAPEKIIGITGTKGKSTTSSLIYQVLKENGVDVILAGNIGKSMLDSIFTIKIDQYLVLELSSFQLQALTPHKVSPKYSVITNIFPDHLNYHKDMDDYIQTKKEICKYQENDSFTFLNKDNEIIGTSEFSKDLKGNIVYFSSKDLPDTFHPILPGEHNLQNFAAALKVAQAFNIPDEKILNTMENFSGVEFRLQLIKEYKGIKIYNDTAATNPGSAVEAFKALPNSIVITGGMNKGLDYNEMADALDQFTKKIYFIEGDTTDELRRLIKNQDKVMGTYNNFEDVLADILEEAKSGDIILFSPGATSFNFWQNEFDRGRKFNEAVSKLTSN